MTKRIKITKETKVEQKTKYKLERNIEDDEVKKKTTNRLKKTKGTYSNPTTAGRILRIRFGLPTTLKKIGHSRYCAAGI